MKVQFQADADLNQIIVKATLRLEPGIDFQTAQTANLAGLKDQDVLKIAKELPDDHKLSGKTICTQQLG